jgi:hypothetical protein
LAPTQRLNICMICNGGAEHTQFPLQEDASSAGEEETEEDLPSAAGKKGGFAALTEEQSDGEGPDPSQTAVNGKAGKPEEADTSDEVCLKPTSVPRNR